MTGILLTFTRLFSGISTKTIWLPSRVSISWLDHGIRTQFGDYSKLLFTPELCLRISVHLLNLLTPHIFFMKLRTATLIWYSGQKYQDFFTQPMSSKTLPVQWTSILGQRVSLKLQFSMLLMVSSKIGPFILMEPKTGVVCFCHHALSS